MQKLAHNLPLQDLIRGVIQNAKDKLAAAEEHEEGGGEHEPPKKDEKKGNPFAKKKDGGKEGEVTVTVKTAGLTDPMYIEKLASACEFIAANADRIEPTHQGVIAQNLQKMAGGKSAPPAVNTSAALKVTEAIGGKQPYKKDQASTNTPEKEIGSELSSAGMPGGKTQLDNNMHDAPGGGSLKPTGKYPEKGPLVNLKKTAGLRDLYIQTLSKEAQEEGQKQASLTSELASHLPSRAAMMGAGALSGGVHGGIAGAISADKGERGKGFLRGAAAGGTVGGALGAVPGKHLISTGLHHPIASNTAVNAALTGAGAAAGAHEGKRLSHGAAGAAIGGGIGAAAGAAKGKAMEHLMKNAGITARDLILQKLAGEDVMKANISASKSGGPIVGDGVMKAYDATQEADGPGGVTSGFGNQARKLIASNAAAINATKKDAKGPVKAQLKEVLDEPALSAKTDSKLKENLRNTGEAGVKIAEQRALLQKIASSGTPQEKQNLRNLIKSASMGGMADGGMTAMAEGGSAPDGCTCGQAGQCRVCKLKGALDAARSQGHPSQQVEKDAAY